VTSERVAIRVDLGAAKERPGWERHWRRAVSSFFAHVDLAGEDRLVTCPYDDLSRRPVVKKRITPIADNANRKARS
jgi:hypothetical protein